MEPWVLEMLGDKAEQGSGEVSRLEKCGCSRGSYHSSTAPPGPAQGPLGPLLLTTWKVCLGEGPQGRKATRQRERTTNLEEVTGKLEATVYPSAPWGDLAVLGSSILIQTPNHTGQVPGALLSRRARALLMCFSWSRGVFAKPGAGQSRV